MVHVDEPDAFEQLAEADLRDELVTAIAALLERQPQVVRLYYVEELNLEEIGHVLGLGAARVSQIKALALARLKKVLAKAVRGLLIAEAAAARWWFAR